jgi:hypothetical protein
MKTLISLAIGVASAALALFADPSVAAQASHETRTMSQSFTSIRLVGSIDLELTQSDTASLSVEGRPDQLPQIRTEVRGSELIIDYDSPIEIHLGSHSSHGPRVLVSAKSIERIKVEGSGDVYVDSWNTAGDFELALSGSGDAEIGSLKARNLTVGISGSDDVKIGGGSVESVALHISGSGDFEGGALKSNSVAVSIAGSGDAVVWANNALSVNIAGSGDVSYYGHPTLSQRIAGSGDLVARGDR